MCCALWLLLWVKVFEGGRLRMAVGHVHSQEKEATRADQSMHVALYEAPSLLSVFIVVIVMVVVVVVSSPCPCRVLAAMRCCASCSLRSSETTPTLLITPEHSQEAVDSPDIPSMPKQRAINEQTNCIAPWWLRARPATQLEHTDASALNIATRHSASIFAGIEELCEATRYSWKLS